MRLVEQMLSASICYTWIERKAMELYSHLHMGHSGCGQDGFGGIDDDGRGSIALIDGLTFKA